MATFAKTGLPSGRLPWHTGVAEDSNKGSYLSRLDGAIEWVEDRFAR